MKICKNLINCNPAVLNSEYAVRGPILERAQQLKKQIINGDCLPFDEIIECNIGNPQQVGQPPISYFRKVLSLVLNPELIKSKLINKLDYKIDVIEKANYYISNTKSIGAYTQSNGLECVRNQIAEFIKNRDDYNSDPNLIFLSNGASDAINLVNKVIIRGEQFKDGLMLPVPQYPLYSALTTLLNGISIPYYLNEKDNWNVDINDIYYNYKNSIKDGITPKTLVVINPGNPTGNLLSKNIMKEIILFCVKHNLLLQADEVYQENIYTDEKFISFKKLACEMGYSQYYKDNNLQLISYHSTSKGFYGECGLRGGYMELFGIDDTIIQQINKLASISLCSNVIGQIITGLVASPPKFNEPSYDEYILQKNIILDSFKKKSENLTNELNNLPNITCNPALGAMYAFPKIDLPEIFIRECIEKSLEPDLAYCLELLENTGIVVVPGSGFGQQPGTYHFRITFLNTEDKMNKIINKFKNFHINFLQKYKQ
jgi:aspartate/methionine/tyrosine aminotransferase